MRGTASLVLVTQLSTIIVLTARRIEELHVFSK